MKTRYASVPNCPPVLDIRSHRLAWPRTEPSQGLNTGSNPVGTTNTYTISENSRDNGVTRGSVENMDSAV